MSSVFAIPFLVANFTAYPGFGDHGIAMPRGVDRRPFVEATVDRGPIVELIVRCHSGTAIVSYAKIERRFCGPKHDCASDLTVVAKRACGD